MLADTKHETHCISLKVNFTAEKVALLAQEQECVYVFTARSAPIVNAGNIDERVNQLF